MEIRRAGPAGSTIGAEILDVDVKTMDDATFRKIYQTWLECNVICVRDQTLAIDDYLKYSRRFGSVWPHPAKSTRHPECPEVTLLGINKFRADGTLDKEIYRRGGEGFHTDGSYEAVPYKATQLYAIAIPSRGGDTFFSSGYAAYEALPQRLKDKLDGKIGAFKYGGRKQLNALLNEEDRHAQPVRHALIQVHPETGRKLLYFDQGKILTIEGLEAAESAAIIQELEAFFVQPPCQYTHQPPVSD
jgi:taurine dioxygenase